MRKGLLAAGVAAVAMLAAGCSTSSTASGEGSGDVVLRLGFLANITHEPALVGLEKGFFAKNLGKHVTLKTTVFSSGTEETTALLAGQLDAAYVGPNPAINAWQKSNGTAIKIMTGAMLPHGAEAVVPVEWTDGGSARVTIKVGAKYGNAVRLAGEDAKAGEVLVTAGTRLRPMHVAVIAAAGRGSVLVRPRPRVVVLSTGNELAEPGTPLVPGRIWDSNSFMLAAAAREAGCLAYRQVALPDHPDEVLPAIEDQLVRADLMITTGGVSMGGEHDVVKAALERLGTITFRKVAMQPGMPQGFGTIALPPEARAPEEPQRRAVRSFRRRDR